MNTSELSEWMVDWQFQNVKMPEHGRSGTICVTAKDEDSAREKAKCTVSRDLFNSATHQDYVTVTGLMEVPKHRAE